MDDIEKNMNTPLLGGDDKPIYTYHNVPLICMFLSMCGSNMFYIMSWSYNKDDNPLSNLAEQRMGFTFFCLTIYFFCVSLCLRSTRQLVIRCVSSTRQFIRMVIGRLGVVIGRIGTKKIIGFIVLCISQFCVIVFFALLSVDVYPSPVDSSIDLSTDSSTNTTEVEVLYYLLSLSTR